MKIDRMYMTAIGIIAVQCPNACDLDIDAIADLPTVHLVATLFDVPETYAAQQVSAVAEASRVLATQSSNKE